MNTVWIKRQLIKTGKALDKDGLIMGGGGNISALSGDVIYIKRKGVAMAESGYQKARTFALVGMTHPPPNWLLAMPSA